MNYLSPTLSEIESQSDIPLIPRTIIYDAKAPDPESYDPSTFASLPGVIPSHDPKRIQTGRSIVGLYDPGNEDFNVRATEQIQDATTEFLQPLIDTGPFTSEARAMMANSMIGKIDEETRGWHLPWLSGKEGGTIANVQKGEDTRRKGSIVAQTVVHEGAHEHEHLNDIVTTPIPTTLARTEKKVRQEWTEAFRAGGAEYPDQDGRWLIDMAMAEYWKEDGLNTRIYDFYERFIEGKYDDVPEIYNTEGKDPFSVSENREAYGMLAGLIYTLNPNDPLSVLRKYNPALVRFYEGFFKASDANLGYMSEEMGRVEAAQEMNRLSPSG